MSILYVGIVNLNRATIADGFFVNKSCWKFLGIYGFVEGDNYSDISEDFHGERITYSEISASQDIPFPLKKRETGHLSLENHITFLFASKKCNLFAKSWRILPSTCSKSLHNIAKFFLPHLTIFVLICCISMWYGFHPWQTAQLQNPQHLVAKLPKVAFAAFKVSVFNILLLNQIFNDTQ